MYDIVKIEFEACVNLGNYEHEKIRLVADVPPQEGDAKQVVNQTIADLRKQVLAAASIDMSEAQRRRELMLREIRKLELDVEESRAKWNAVADFLRAQGLKPDAMHMPEFQPLLPHITQEEQSVEYSDPEETLP